MIMLKRPIPAMDTNHKSMMGEKEKPTLLVPNLSKRKRRSKITTDIRTT